MARSNRGLLLVFLVCFLIGSITFPSAHAQEDVAADAVVDEDTIDMDTPAVKEEPVVEEKVVEEEVEVEEEIVEEVKEPETPAPLVEDVKEPEEEIVTSKVVAEETSPNKISIPFLSKLTKQDAKKIAAFSLGAWGAATGVGWAMQQFGGDSD